jgi:hypothetical protein
MKRGHDEFVLLNFPLEEQKAQFVFGPIERVLIVNTVGEDVNG